VAKDAEARNVVLTRTVVARVVPNDQARPNIIGAQLQLRLPRWSRRLGPKNLR